MANPNDQDLLEIEPDALRAAEFMQAQHLLAQMIGRRIVSADVEETRIVIRTDDGTAYFFYGFMGEERREPPAE
jgi:hypothetical protein